MTDLTEKWKKGALQSGWYWVELKEGTFADGKKSIVLDYFSELTNSFERHPYLVEQILAPVPSYEEWQAKLNENEQLKTEYEKECHRADELEDSYWKAEKENQKLKELLKRCYSFIDWCELGVPVAQRPILMKDINKALGEE